MQANREELVERIAGAIREDGTIQPLVGLYLSRTTVPLKRVHSVIEPSVAVIVQGSKEVLFGVPPMRDVQRLWEEALAFRGQNSGYIVK